MIKRHLYTLSACSGLLLALSFPKAGFYYLVWPALILFWRLQLSTSSYKESYFVSAFAGIVFFPLSLFWLNHVAVVGWFFVFAFQIIFWLFLGFLCFQFKRFQNAFIRSFLFAVSWCLIEWMRAEIPIVGLGWNLVAYSQTPFLEFIQFADVVGAFGVGFVIAWVSSLVAEALFDFKRIFKVIGLLTFSIILFSAVFVYGQLALDKKTDHLIEAQNQKVRASVIQGNIPQSVKWEPMARDEIFDIYTKLSQLAHFQNPQMIVWPEAAFPNYFNRDANSDLILDWAKELETSFLVGAPYLESRYKAYNSAFFINQRGVLDGRYDKIRLVPFGEYVPFDPFLNFLKPLARSLGISDFSSGRAFPLFYLTKSHPFGVLICFEDTFSDLSRKFADKGATFLTVITNDAWFKLSAAPHQHLQTTVFRAIETGLSIVRAANTGISGFINLKGEFEFPVERDGRRMEIAGYSTHSISTEPYLTLFRQGGWLFPYLLSLVFLMFLSISFFYKNKEKEEAV
jgi:apolipoprotein N-acyltransferase